MGARIIQFGIIPSSILAAFAGNGYEVHACGTSIPKLKEALRQPDHLDAVALAENGASQAVGVLTDVHSLAKVPLILFQDATKTYDPSQFDLVIPEHAPLPNLLERVAALIERSRAIRAETRLSSERFHFLLRQAASLHEQTVAAGVESTHIIRKARFERSVTERVKLPCVLVVDDYVRWRDVLCSMVQECVDCRSLHEAGDGIEAVQLATKLQPELILLDLDLPRQNGIEAARQITQFSPDSAILIVSMTNCAEVVCEALSTGAKGYLLKADAGTELWPAIAAVLQGKQYLSRGLRGLHSVGLN